MPTYPYRCKKCGFEFEEFQSITEDALTTCPQCKGELVRIITGGAGLLFKGTGFYETDYRTSGYRSDAKKESSASATSSSGSSSSSTSDSSGSSKSSTSPAPAKSSDKSKS